MLQGLLLTSGCVQGSCRVQRGIRPPESVVPGRPCCRERGTAEGRKCPGRQCCGRARRKGRQAGASGRCPVGKGRAAGNVRGRKRLEAWSPVSRILRQRRSGICWVCGEEVSWGFGDRRARLAPVGHAETREGTLPRRCHWKGKERAWARSQETSAGEMGTRLQVYHLRIFTAL